MVTSSLAPSPKLATSGHPPPPRRRCLTLAWALGVLALTVPDPSQAKPTGWFQATSNPADPSRITLSWSIQGGRSTNLLYIYPDVGFRATDCNPDPAVFACSTSFHVEAPGIYRYHLSVRDDAGVFLGLTEEVEVPSLPVPTLITPTRSDPVNLWATTNTRLEWTHPGGPGYTEVTGPVRGGTYTPTGFVNIPINKLPVGDSNYGVRYCQTTSSRVVTAAAAGTVLSWTSATTYRSPVLERQILGTLDTNPDPAVQQVLNVTSPQRGRVVTIHAQPGAVVAAGAPLLTVESRYCSEYARTQFWKGASRFDAIYRDGVEVGPGSIDADPNGYDRVFVRPWAPPFIEGEGLRVTWKGPGQLYRASSWDLGYGALVGEQEVTIPSSLLSQPGVYVLELVSCMGATSTTPLRCDTLDLVTTPPDLSGTVVQIVGPPANLPNGSVNWFGTYSAGDVIARVETTTGDVVDVLVGADQGGTLDSIVANVGTEVVGGGLIALLSADTHIRPRLEIVVQEEAWTFLPASDVFGSVQLHEAWKRNTSGDVGNPLDVVVTASGDLWAIGEFAQGATQVSGGETTHHNIPLQKSWDAERSLYVPQKPFRSSLYKNTPVSFAEFHEKILEGEPGSIWWSQGGGGYTNEAHNHSRIVHFDQNADDNPDTPNDERFCVYNLPGDSNVALGLAWQDGRLYIAEYGLQNGHTPTLSSFVPSEVATCGNMLDWTTYDPYAAPPTAPASPLVLPVCSASGQTGCLTQHPVPAVMGGIALMELDPDGDALWFTDFSQRINRFDLNEPEATAFQTFNLPPSVNPDRNLFAPGPWQLRVDADYVYVGLYFDTAVARFDKHRLNDPACQSPAGQPNPCIEVVFAPRLDRKTALHSLELDDGGTTDPSDDKLWFTLGGASPAPDRPEGNTLAFIRLADWGPGVFLTDLGGVGPVVAPARRQVGATNFAGISIDRATGAVVVNDYLYKQLLQFDP